jgi:hypothetical protein
MLRTVIRHVVFVCRLRMLNDFSAPRWGLCIINVIVI